MICGIDPASKKIALFGQEGYTFSKTMNVTRSDRGRELRALRAQLEAVLATFEEPVIFCEQPVVAGVRNIQSTLRIAETVGMIYALDVPVYGVSVSSWKKATVGKGNASKDDVKTWLESVYPTYSVACGNDQDLRDAAAICVYGVQAMDANRLRAYFR